MLNPNPKGFAICPIWSNPFDSEGTDIPAGYTLGPAPMAEIVPADARSALPKNNAKPKRNNSGRVRFTTNLHMRWAKKLIRESAQSTHLLSVWYTGHFVKKKNDYYA